jgi:predicted nucleic acid-binding protein
MTFIDTGYLIALLNPRDEFHSRALAWSGRVVEPPNRDGIRDR